MADWYVDPEGGNDSNNGTTFALRKKTIASIPGASLVAGDRVKVMASRTPNSVGNATWTDNSTTITLAAAKTANVHTCDSGWVGGTGVTVTHPGSTRKEGTSFANLSINSATVTGAQKLAYAPTAANLDLSAYQALSLYVFVDTSSWADGVMSLNLCSDATGDVPLVSLPLNKVSGVLAVNYMPQLLENAGNLPSGINSISLSCSAPPVSSGTRVIRLDNIIACKAVTDPDHLSLTCAIGKNTGAEPEWYPIQSINGTTIVMGNGDANMSAPGRSYRGVSETVPLYVLQGTYTGWSAAERTVAGNGGTAASPVLISGGWDRTNMSTRNGETWINGRYYFSTGFVLSVTGKYIYFEGIGGMHLSTALIDESSGVDRGKFKAVLPGAVNCNKAFQLYSGSSYLHALDLDFGNLSHMVASEVIMDRAASKVRARRLTNSRLNLSTTTWATGRGMQDIVIGQLDNSSIALGANGSGMTGFLRGATFKWNTQDVSMPGVVELDNCKFPEGAPKVNLGIGEAIITAMNGDAWDNRRYNERFTILTDATTFRTAGYRSVKMSVLHATMYSLETPLRHPLLKVAGKAGVPITFEAYVQRDNTGIGAGICTMDSFVDGVGATSQVMSAAANTWEKLTLTVTPTKDGVVELFGFAYGGTTYSAWFTEAKMT